MSIHRQENVDVRGNLKSILEIINAIAMKYDKKQLYLLTQERRID